MFFCITISICQKVAHSHQMWSIKAISFDIINSIDAPKGTSTAYPFVSPDYISSFESSLKLAFQENIDDEIAFDY